MIKVSIVIPSYEGKDLLNPLLSDLKKIIDKNIEIIVVDNGSKDDTIQFLNQIYPWVHAVRLSKNMGFTGGVNAGAKIAQGEWILILNNDCFIKNDTINHLIETCHQNGFVATTPLLLNPEGKIENAGYFVDLVKGKVELNFDIGKANKSLSETKLFGITAACMLVSKKIFDECGGFDESFHSYLDDIDFSLRMMKKGYKYGVSVDQSCIHHHQSTSKKMGTYKQIQDFKNWWRILFKYRTFSQLLFTFPFWFPERLRNLSGWWKAKFRQSINTI